MQDVSFPDLKTYSDAIPKSINVSCSVTFELITILNFANATSLPAPTQSTPLSARIMDLESSLRNGDRCPQACDLELAPKALHVRSLLLDILRNISPPSCLNILMSW